MSISHVYECESHATVQQEKEMKMLLIVEGGSKELYISQNFELKISYRQGRKLSLSFLPVTVLSIKYRVELFGVGDILDLKGQEIVRYLLCSRGGHTAPRKKN